MQIDELGGTLGEALLVPTRIYVRPLLELIRQCDVKAVSHITGGGFYENIPRMMKSGYSAKIELDSFPKLPIFSLLQSHGNISQHDMYNTFNMGIGMCLAVSKTEADKAVSVLKEAGENAYIIGEVVEGEEGVILC